MSKNTVCWGLCLLFAVAFALAARSQGATGLEASSPWLAGALVLAGLE